MPSKCRMPPEEFLGAVVAAEAELVLEPDRAHQAQRICLEDAVCNGTNRAPCDVLPPAEGIDEIASADRARHGVQGEIAAGKVILDTRSEWGEVDRAPVLERDPPGTVPLGERERRTAPRPRERPRSELGLTASDIEVDDGAAEELVAQGAANEPTLRARKRLAQPVREVTHRRIRAWLSRVRTGCRS
jgi:hypothetical protein